MITMKQITNYSKLLTNKLKSWYGTVVLVIATVTIVVICIISTAEPEQVTKDVGESLVNAMYTFDSLDDLYDSQEEQLTPIVSNDVLQNICVSLNPKRTKWAYNDMENHSIHPVIIEHRPGYIEFILNVDGEDDSLHKGIWYETDSNGIVCKFLEANLNELYYEGGDWIYEPITSP